MPKDRAHILTVLSLVALAAAAPRAALGQNALGSGDVLDANTMVGARGRNSVADRFVDTRVRNLLVTRNVPAGREFRGSVGYTAPRDFRGVTGADDNYAFRADSALSAGSLTRFGPQYDAMRFGGGMDRATYRRDFTNTIADIPDARGQDVDTHRTQSSAVRLDRFVPASVVSSSARLESQPQVVGIIMDQAGRSENALVVEASPLRGIQTLEGSEQRRALAGLSVYDRLRLEEDAARGLDTQLAGDPFRTSFDPVEFTERFVLAGRDDETVNEARSESQRLETINEGVRQYTRIGETDEATDYQEVLVRIAERYAKTQNITWNLQPRLMEYLGDDYEALRERLTGDVVADAEAAAEDPLTPPPDPDAQEQMEDNLRRLLPSRRDTGTGDDPEAEEPERPTREELELLGSVLRHGQKIDQLVSARAQGRFEQLVRSAEERLADGEYFWAERRFRRALRFVPGHPLATAGLGHVQLGAGLYRSAALTLRKLVTSQPEMIDVRYADALLPGRVRLITCVDEIRDRAGIAGQERLSGFLLAYIGHQTEDAALLSEGLDAMAAADPEDELVTVLREVWSSDR